ncbi:MAG: RNA-binding transcriptional accessory protein [Bacteroidales bacterium]|nr:RNA-binding transcriptional accessory protein [Bacteroidales bacterium]
MFNDRHIRILSERLGIAEHQVRNTLGLLEEGATIPFISRYRKEATGSLDEVQIDAIRTLYGKLQEIDKRRAAILKSIEEQGKLTDELRASLEATDSLQELEDLYLPFRPKRKTRASAARDKGLEPLARQLMAPGCSADPETLAGKFLSDAVPDTASALQGARDIMAEWISDSRRSRQTVRRIFDRQAVIRSAVIKGKAQDGIVYQHYFDFQEPLRKSPSHRILAMLRGEREGILKVTIAAATQDAVQEALIRNYIPQPTSAAGQIEMAVRDSCNRLLLPAMETEYKQRAKERADTDAIRIFADNLRQLLLAPPLGEKAVLAIDPGFRTGCKVVCLDPQGNLMHNETIFPHPPQSEVVQATRKITSLVSAYKIEAIAIGNGTAGRETERFIQRLIFGRDVQVFSVNESGASVYSASAVAREEFPDYDVTVRGAVSIGRRLMDPLSELVKIDPKSIGVGQYQHDVDQGLLKASLDTVVESCVNHVGVNVNTAGRHLLTYVSGVGPQLAQRIVDYRTEHGPFSSREELKSVPRMGSRTFEQCAGFLRIPDADNPLDNSAVHPESYAIVNRMAEDLHTDVRTLLKDRKLQQQIDLNRYVTSSQDGKARNDKTEGLVATEHQVGLPTLQDIMQELAKPGRDPRSRIDVFEFSQDVHQIEDVQPGMILPGIVTNITDFGCFVDIGVKQDGLVHVSQLAGRYVKHPSEVVKVYDHVQVKVLDVDVARKRISLSMKNLGN